MGNVRQITGSRPEGATGEADSARAVREMFDQVAPRYDLLNHLLSCNIDRLWWWRTARRFRHILGRPEAQALDICCGTGDLTLALLRHRPAVARPLIAADFSRPMLDRAARKLPSSRVTLLEADALHLPMADGSVDLITSAFGFRNLVNYQAALEEFFRALSAGGELGILDFSQPGGLVGRAYGFYFRRVLPALGTRISGVHGAYAYLPASVGNFPAPAIMLDMMRQAGFVDVSWTPYTFGIAGLWRGIRPAHK